MHSQNTKTSEIEYKKILIDNAVCNRRFHLVYEEKVENEKHVKIDCPHCGVTLFEKDNHPPVMLTREENLVNAPNGVDAKIMYDCKFYKKLK